MIRFQHSGFRHNILILFTLYLLSLQFSRGGGASSGGSSMGNAGFCGSRHTNTVKPGTGSDHSSQEPAMLCDICSTKFTLFNRKVISFVYLLLIALICAHFFYRKYAQSAKATFAEAVSPEKRLVGCSRCDMAPPTVALAVLLAPARGAKSCYLFLPSEPISWNFESKTYKDTSSPRKSTRNLA